MAPPIPEPRPRRRKRRRPEPAQYARTAEGRVRVWEWTTCGEPLDWPHHVSHEQPPCLDLPTEDEDDLTIYHPAEV